MGGSAPRRRGRRHGPGIAPWLAGKGDLLAASAYLVVIMLFGGGPVAWGPGYVLLAVATISLAVFLAWQDGWASLVEAPPAGRLALAGVAILPLLQLVPLPPALWQTLPGQALRHDALALAGLAGSWQPLSLEPVATALCAVMAIGFLAFTVLLLRLGDADFTRMLRLAFALVLLGIAVGSLQVVSDGQFPQIQTDNMGGTMLGFYANKNHMGLAIACSILLLGLTGVRDMARERRRLAVIGYSLFALIAIVTTNSRAGLVFGLLAAAAVLADLARGVALRYRIAALVAVALLAVAIMSSSAFELVSGRIGEVGSDLRWRFTAWSWPLFERYWALGSGIGSFRTLFMTHEQLAWVKPTYVNAVHNEYLQLVIESGVPGVLLVLLLLLSLAGGIGAFRALPRRNPHRREMIFGWAVLALFAIHSAIDYPLRRPAAWALFALALAAAYRGQAAQKPSGRREIKQIEAA